MTKAGVAYTANSADAATEDDQPVDRPPTDAEQEYLETRVAETAANVKVIEAVVKGAQQTLAAAKVEAAEAKAALKAAGGAQ